MLDHMTLDELLRRKAVDYGYGTLAVFDSVRKAGINQHRCHLGCCDGKGEIACSDAVDPVIGQEALNYGTRAEQKGGSVKRVADIKSMEIVHFLFPLDSRSYS